MASHQGGPSRIGTPAPLCPLPTTENLDHLVSLFHQTATDLGLPAACFLPITPETISTLSIGEQMLLPLLCTSLQSSVHIATALENLSTEIHDLFSQVANLDFSPQPPNLAPLQTSLRDIASRLPSAAQASFPPNALVPHSRPYTPLVGPVPPPPATPTPLAKRKQRKELLRLHPHHRPIRSGPPPQLIRICRDMTCQLLLPQCMATLRRLPKSTPTPGKRRNSRKGNTPPVPLGPPVTWTPTGSPHH